MRFVMTPVGSGGDVRPFVHIGSALARSGHDVVLLAAEPFGDLVRQAGLRFVDVWPAVEYEREALDPDLWNPRRGMGLVLRIIGAHLQNLWDAVESVWLPGHTVLVTHTLAFAPRAFAEKHAVPAAALHLAPSVFRSQYDRPVLPDVDLNRLPRTMVRPLWWLIDRLVIDPMIAPVLNDWRERRGLPPLHRVFRDAIHARDLVLGLFPEWFAARQTDFPPQTRITGFPLSPMIDEPLDPTLDAWLQEGEPPVLVTPGTANRQAAHFLRTAIEGATRIGRRVLVVTPWTEQTPTDSRTVRTFAYVPFAAMLDRCAAIVHHGGIGTCAQGLRSGVPQLVMPMAFDQPDNAARLRRLGVGTAIPPRRFTTDAVAQALQPMIRSGEIASSCIRWRDRVAEEDGIAAACVELERLAL